ncbi:MAG TPA: hopanoid-associated sugar epimerase [Methylocella sp.]|nr:hopanoid-associated sugar epimerase [Methylocella sp.]
MANDTVLVTGASGFVGSAVARVLAASGYKVRALLRDASKEINLAGLDIKIVRGDMRDAAAVSRAMRDARFLVHAAADYRLWARDPSEILTTNREGTRILMEAALAHGVERIVYTSSVATLACAANGKPADETMPMTESCAIGAYKKSKVAAERIVEAMISRNQLPAIIVHPTAPVGPGDHKPTPTGRVIIEAACGAIPGFVDTGLNIVHVDDVARGHLAALRHGKPGEHYILGGQNVLLEELLHEIARMCGRPAPWIRLPRPLLYPCAALSEAKAYVTGREPLLTFDGLRMSKNRMFFSSRKAERELGYKARPYAEAIADALAWFRDRGRLR